MSGIFQITRSVCIRHKNGLIFAHTSEVVFIHKIIICISVYVYDYVLHTQVRLLDRQYKLKQQKW